jgi:thiol-disulfide isomerase/thioredoxin
MLPIAACITGPTPEFIHMTKSNFLQALFSGLMLLMLGSTSISAQEAATKTVKLDGQFVCSVCWLEADRKTTAYGTAADMDCARECAENNVPPAIAVKETDDYRLVLVEEGKLKKPPETWLHYMGKQVSVSGRLRSADGKQFIALDGLTVTGEGILAQESAAIGTQPDLALKDLFGVEQKLSAYSGKVVVLNFWATWCLPCRKEMPDLAAIQNEYAALGVQVVGASADALTDRQKVVTFIKETGINFPVWLGATTEEMKRFGLGPALPGTVVIGRDGKLLAIKNGVITRDYLKKQIDTLLAADTKVVNKAIAASRPSKIAASSVPS